MFLAQEDDGRPLEYYKLVEVLSLELLSELNEVEGRGSLGCLVIMSAS